MKQESLDLLNKWFPEENWDLLSETETINLLIEMILAARDEAEYKTHQLRELIAIK